MSNGLTRARNALIGTLVVFLVIFAIAKFYDAETSADIAGESAPAAQTTAPDTTTESAAADPDTEQPVVVAQSGSVVIAVVVICAVVVVILFNPFGRKLW